MSSPEGATPDPQLAHLVETWHDACASFVALVRDLAPEDGALPTDLTGWSVADTVAHTAHLEAVLAGTPEETIEVPPAPHLVSLVHVYTEQGVLARRGRSLAELADELEAAVATRHAALQADPPVDGSAPAPKTPGDVPWDHATLLANRPLDVWMHEQDVRRATGRPGGYDTPAATHTLRRLAGGLAMVVGKRVRPPAGTVVRLEVPEAALVRTVQVGDDGRAAVVAAAAAGAPTTTVTLSAEDFVVLAGGRRTPDRTSPRVTGDADLARRLLASWIWQLRTLTVR